MLGIKEGDMTRIHLWRNENGEQVMIKEVGVDQLGAGDVIRVRLYEGSSGELFASPVRNMDAHAMVGQDVVIARIEDAVMPCNGRCQSATARIAVSGTGDCFTLAHAEYWRVGEPGAGSQFTPEPHYEEEDELKLARHALPPPGMTAQPRPDLLREARTENLRLDELEEGLMTW
ncbi:MAG: hypothetical protein RLZZ324_763 [Candidatus Parcubacteria bacterium]|jgi:hypothetical protein